MKYLYVLQHGRKVEYDKSLTGEMEEKDKQVHLITLRKGLVGKRLIAPQTFTSHPHCSKLQNMGTV